MSFGACIRAVTTLSLVSVLAATPGCRRAKTVPTSIECEPGWKGPKCDVPACQPGVCGNGTCKDTDEGFECLCDAGWEGKRCKCASDGSTCSGHGDCSDTGGVVECTCREGYSGDTCSACDTGFQDNDGDGTCLPACDAETCSGHGKCDDGSGNTVCSCDQGYTGEDCSLCDTSYQDNDGDGVCAPVCDEAYCSGHGTCSDATGKRVCECEKGYAGDMCDTCDASKGFRDDGEGGCTDDPCKPNPCDEPNKGVCKPDGGQAVCSCDAGYQDNDGNGTCVPVCDESYCSGHGTCSDATGEQVCECETGYAGDRCDACDADGGFHDDGEGGCTDDPCKPNPCEDPHKGLCKAEGGVAVCSCDAGFQDNDSDGICLEECSAGDCGDHGTCSDAGGQRTCTCDAGFQDNDTDLTCLPDCSREDCSGHGECSDESGKVECTCESGRSGERCEMVVLESVGYSIDAYEVTNERFAAFLNAHGNECQGNACYDPSGTTARISRVDDSWEVDDGYQDYPMVYVTWFGAAEACAYEGKELCSGSTWTHACHAGNGTSYPYGDTYNGTACNGTDRNADDTLMEVGSNQGCESGDSGVFDMSGNAWEWTADSAGSDKIIAGGSYLQGQALLECASTLRQDPGTVTGSIGFRCCKREE